MSLKVFSCVYGMRLQMVVIWMLLLLLLWANLCQHINKKRWAAINSVIFGLSAATILYATILTRSAGVPEAVLAPFASLTAARIQPELYRAMLMNVFLFFPLGLTLSNALPRKWHRWLRIILTTLIGCILSAGIEYAQYRYALGLAETDDVICNTLGAFLGAASLLAAHAIEKHKERAWHNSCISPKLLSLAEICPPKRWTGLPSLRWPISRSCCRSSLRLPAQRLPPEKTLRCSL